MTITVLPATPDRWTDVETVFGAKGCSVARGCWCMHYRRSGTLTNVASRAKIYRAGLEALVAMGKQPGLIAYRDGVPVGWVSLAPREEFERLRRSPVMKPVDDRPVWSIICFVVPPEHRGQGVARALLQGAIAYAREHGATVVEAYPVDKKGPSKGDTLWFGAKSMYDHAGFKEVARRKPTRPVVRLDLYAERQRPSDWR
jgi:GNAT superfamily N-acetyltransferase